MPAAWSPALRHRTQAEQCVHMLTARQHLLVRLAGGGEFAGTLQRGTRYRVNPLQGDRVRDGRSRRAFPQRERAARQARPSRGEMRGVKSTAHPYAASASSQRPASGKTPPKSVVHRETRVRRSRPTQAEIASSAWPN
jgi:hypothetical protein